MPLPVGTCCCDLSGARQPPRRGRALGELAESLAPAWGPRKQKAQQHTQNNGPPRRGGPQEADARAGRRAGERPLARRHEFQGGGGRASAAPLTQPSALRIDTQQDFISAPQAARWLGMCAHHMARHLSVNNTHRKISHRYIRIECRHTARGAGAGPLWWGEKHRERAAPRRLPTPLQRGEQLPAAAGLRLPRGRPGQHSAQPCGGRLAVVHRWLRRWRQGGGIDSTVQQMAPKPGGREAPSRACDL